VRFIFFGSEEIGVRGARYAGQISRLDDEDIVAMLNVDMIGWDSDGSGVVEVHRRALDGTAETRGDLSIANTFVAVTSTYRISGIRPQVMADGLDWSDHRGYWRADYSAAFVVELGHSVGDPVWHTSNDTMSLLSWDYYLSNTKAVLATSAHLGLIRTPAPKVKSPAPRATLPGAAVVGSCARARDRCGPPSRLTRSPEGRGGVRTHEGLAPLPVFRPCRMTP